MDHSEAQDLFSDYLEGELTPEARAELGRHLQGCQACRKELEEFQKTLRSLSGLHLLPPPPDFASKIQQRIHRRSRGRFFGAERFIMRLPFEWISFIIIIIMLVLYMLMMEQGKKVQQLPGTGSSRPVPEQPLPRPQPPPR